MWLCCSTHGGAACFLDMARYLHLIPLSFPLPSLTPCPLSRDLYLLHCSRKKKDLHKSNMCNVQVSLLLQGTPAALNPTSITTLYMPKAKKKISQHNQNAAQEMKSLLVLVFIPLSDVSAARSSGKKNEVAVAATLSTLTNQRLARLCCYCSCRYT